MKFIEKSKIFLKLSKYLFKYGNKDIFSDVGINIDEKTSSSSIDEDAKDFVKDLESLGPTYIKLGQLLSTRRELLPKEFIEALKRLQSNVEPISFDEVKSVIEEEFETKISHLYESFDENPLATASLGQVHRATLKDGVEVVVKVQRPRIAKVISDDLIVIRKIVNFLNDHSESFRRFHAKSIVDEFESNIIRELNYLDEAFNLNKINNNLKSFENIIFPTSYKSYTTERVLTMDFIDGKNLNNLSEFAVTEIDGKTLANDIFKAYLKQIFVDGFFHSDPHLGNILLINNKKIGILDLGMVTRLGPELRQDLLALIVSISSGKGKETAEQAFSLASNIDGVSEDVAGFKESISHMVKEEYDRSIDQMKAGSVLMDISKIASRSGLYFPQELTSIARTLMYLDDLGRILDPQFNPHLAVRENALTLFKANYSSDLSFSDLFLGANEIKKFIHEFPTKINRILDDVTDQKFKIKVDAIDEVLLLRGIQKVANRITTGLILAAMIVSAAMMMKVESGFTLFGYPGLAILLFAFAFIGSFSLILNILFKDK